MTLLEMLDVLEVGCTTLQQRSSELAAALDDARNNVSYAGAEAPKRSPAKRKSKAAKGRSKSSKAKTAKKTQLTLAMGADDAVAVPGEASKSEEAPKRGKRQALGMSFSKLRASIQARRAERRGEEAP